MAMFNIAGLGGSITIAVAENRTKALTNVVKLGNGLGVVFAIMMLEVSAPSCCSVVHETHAVTFPLLIITYTVHF